PQQNPTGTVDRAMSVPNSASCASTHRHSKGLSGKANSLCVLPFSVPNTPRYFSTEKGRLLRGRKEPGRQMTCPLGQRDTSPSSSSPSLPLLPFSVLNTFQPALHARMARTTSPSTSVNRKSRPPYLYVKRS